MDMMEQEPMLGDKDLDSEYWPWFASQLSRACS